MADVAQTAPDAPVLELKNLAKSYGAIDVLKSLNAGMARGDFLVLVGPSGCGKSTLLNCIAGLDDVTGGEIVINGRDVTKVPPRDRDIAMVFQSYALYPTMTVAENIAFGMKVRRVPSEIQRQKVDEVAKLLQISHLLDRKPSALSGGQRQRVAMGRALVREPVLFLFDEPLSNLDAKLRVEMRGEIKRLHERLNASIVYVTHDQIEAMTLGTRIVVLNHGVIQQIGTPADIYERPANLFVADFMGSPPMNLIHATYSADKGGIVTFNGTLARLPAKQAGLRPGPVVVGIRPEAFVPGKPGESALTLNAASVENAGSDTFVEFELGGKEITARLPGRMRTHAGDSVPLDVDLSTVSYFDPETQLRIG
jgi:multiple sugar transport system ATP-binding protein